MKGINRTRNRNLLTTTFIGMAFIAMAGSALAIPSWMGVYGDFGRHDGLNPGTFTVLMNQDYAGLHAEVGLQVDSGGWTTLPLSYVGNADGNSIWQSGPGAALPGGSTVTYYFHGWDDWGGNIWDSNDGANFSFTASGSSSALTFGDPASVPAGMDSGQADIFAVGNDLYAVAAGESEFRAGHRDLSGSDWDAWQTLQSTSSVNSPTVVANAQAVVALGTVGADLYVYRSTDGGATYASPTIVTIPTSQFGFSALDACAYGSDEFHVVLSTPTVGGEIWYLGSSDSGQTWSTPVTVDTGFWGGSPRIGADADNVYIAHLMAGGQRHSGFIAAVSADGVNWNLEELDSVLGGTTVGRPELVATPAGVYAILARYNGETRVWTYAGSNWQELSSAPGLSPNGGQYLRGTSLPGGELALVSSSYGQDPLVAVGNPMTGTWGPAQPIANAPEGLAHELVAAAGNVYLLSDGTALNLQVSGDLPEPGLEWFGNTYHWPFNGDIDPGEVLWFNIETFPQGEAMVAKLHYAVNGGNWLVTAMNLDGPLGENDHWNVNLVGFPAGAVIEYAIEVIDQEGVSHWDTDGGTDYFAQVNGGGEPVQWWGNVWSWPFQGDIDAGEDFWVNIDTWPIGTATDVLLVYTDDGVTWYGVDMDLGGQADSNDWWHVNLGGFDSGTHIQYAIRVRDGLGNEYWENNEGGDFHADVN